MESITYKSEVAFELEAIKEKAQSSGYQSDYKSVGNLIFLDITVTLLPYLKQWQWDVADEATLRILNETNPKRMAQYPSGSVYVINFTPSTVLELACFLKPVLKEYGGWVGLDDEMEVVFDAENIEALTDDPIFSYIFSS